jgi:hypothetical protein
MLNRFRKRAFMPFAALTLAALLGGCVAYPSYPGYGYYGGGYGGGYYANTPYYSGATVAFGTGWGWRGHDRDHDWHDHDGRWRR